MVSELLGSFGDNESSPECLDGAVRYLKRKRRIREAQVYAQTESTLLYYLAG